MVEQTSHDRRRVRRARWGLVIGLVMMLLCTPALVIVALAGKADWAVIAATATFAVGLVTVGSFLAPGGSSFRGGTKIWQNDGRPGGT